MRVTPRSVYHESKACLEASKKGAEGEPRRLRDAVCRCALRDIDRFRREFAAMSTTGMSPEKTETSREVRDASVSTPNLLFPSAREEYRLL